MASTGDYLPPLVTELKADYSDLAKGFAEAKRLQAEYKRSVEDLGDTWQESTESSREAEQAVTDLERTTSRSTTRMKRDTDAAGESAKRFGRTSKKAYEDTGEAIGKASKEVGEFDKLVKRNAYEGESAVSALRREYDRVASRVSFLRRELGKADSSKRGHLFGSLKESSDDLGKITKIGAELGIELGSTASKTLVQQLGSGIGAVTSALGPFGAVVVGAIIAAIVTGAPAIGAALAVAVGLGLGAGVIGLAIAVLKDDKGIKKAWEGVTKVSSGVFERSAHVMRKPFIDALNDIKKELPSLEGPLSEMFAAARPLVAPLEKGFMASLKELLPGITDALTNMQPVFAELGDDMPLLAASFADFFRTITENKEELTLFAHDSMYVLSGFIMMLGELIGWLASTYAAVRGFFKDAKDAILAFKNWLFGWLDDMADWVWEKAYAIGQALGLGLAGGMGGSLKKVKGAGEGLADGAVAAIGGRLQVHSPSRVTEHLGVMTALGYAGGVRKGSGDVWDALAQMIAPGGAARATMGYDAALAMTRPAGGYAAAAAAGVTHVTLELDGRALTQALVPHSQRDALRNAGESGLGNRGSF